MAMSGACDPGSKHYIIIALLHCLHKSYEFSMLLIFKACTAYCFFLNLVRRFKKLNEAFNQL